MTAKVIITILIAILCVVARLIWNKKNVDKKPKQDDISLLLSKTNNAYKYIFDSITEERFSPYVESSPHYDLFKERCIADIYNEINDKIDKEGTSWIGSSINKAAASDMIYSILNSKDIDIKLSSIFVKVIENNIIEAKKNESEAIAYNNKFGKEPMTEPELHPIEPKTEDSTDDQFVERSLDELSSTGTVEDIEE